MTTAMSTVTVVIHHASDRIIKDAINVNNRIIKDAIANRSIGLIPAVRTILSYSGIKWPRMLTTLDVTTVEMIAKMTDRSPVAPMISAAKTRRCDVMTLDDNNRPSCDVMIPVVVIRHNIKIETLAALLVPRDKIVTVPEATADGLAVMKIDKARHQIETITVLTMPIELNLATMTETKHAAPVMLVVNSPPRAAHNLLAVAEVVEVVVRVPLVEAPDLPRAVAVKVDAAIVDEVIARLPLHIEMTSVVALARVETRTVAEDKAIAVMIAEEANPNLLPIPKETTSTSILNIFIK